MRVIMILLKRYAPVLRWTFGACLILGLLGAGNLAAPTTIWRGPDSGCAKWGKCLYPFGDFAGASCCKCAINYGSASIGWQNSREVS